MHLVALDPDPRSGDDDAATLRLAIDRLAVADDDALDTAMADLLTAAAHAGVTTVTVAAHPSGPTDDQVAAGHGLVPMREMLQLRRSLPLPPDQGAAGLTVPMRAFRPGQDDEAWLAVNNRAFAWHPEQAGWTVDHLRARVTEPWFDVRGFLVHDGVDGAIDGFCWTKVHPATDLEPTLGEIFVIGVDPDAHGQGLGRALMIAGLDHLTAQGSPMAMLYVEADNAPARRLYETLGFIVHERHRWWTTPPPP